MPAFLERTQHGVDGFKLQNQEWKPIDVTPAICHCRGIEGEALARWDSCGDYNAARRSPAFSDNSSI